MSPFVTYIPNNGNGTAIVMLNRPSKRNALSGEMQEALTEAFEKIRDDDSVKRVVLQAADLTNFCAGVDMHEMKQEMQLEGREAKDVNLQASLRYANMLDTVASCGKPMIGIVSGSAIGAGTTLAALCDYVVAGDDTVFRYPERMMNLKPSVSAAYAVNRMGRDNALPLFSSGRKFTAAEAKTMKLVDETCPADKLRDRMQTVISRFESRPLQRKPGNPTLSKVIGDREMDPKMVDLVDRMMPLYDDRSGPGREAFVKASAQDLAEDRSHPEAKDVISHYIEKRVYHHAPPALPGFKS